MSPPRFYVASLPPDGLVELERSDAVHASNVLRLTVGDELELFDGQGRVATGSIFKCGKREVQVQLGTFRQSAAGEVLNLHWIVSLPKGDRQKVLVDGLTQLGVRSLTPLVCHRSVAQPVEKSLERLRRAVIESCKQCGRSRLMEVRPARDLDSLAGEYVEACRIFAHPYGKTTPIRNVAWDSERDVVAVIGPEGGLTEEECDKLGASGWSRVSLGSNILRIEMAALSLASFCALRHSHAGLEASD